MIEGTFEFDTCKETVPDLQTAKTEFNKTCSLISSYIFSDSLSQANEDQFLGLLVEGDEGIKNIAEISKVQGIDLIYIGLFDLAKSIGMVDNLTDSKILKLLKDTKEIIQANGVMVGSMAKDVEYAKILSDLGYDFIAFYNDSAALKSYFQNAIKDIKAN